MNETDKTLEPDEAYALERFANMTDEERREMIAATILTGADAITDTDILAMLRDEYWEMLDAQSGQVKAENAEIESHMIPLTKKH